MDIKSSSQCSADVKPLVYKWHLRFVWLKAPSVLLLVIGIAGILKARTDYFHEAFSFMALPPFISSLIITGLACLLFGIALFCKGPVNPSDSDVYTKNWRSI